MVTVDATKIETEHWCIKSQCNHGTLNGSLHYGSSLLKSYNDGYKQGWADLMQDIVEGRIEVEARVSTGTGSDVARKS